MQNVEQIKKNTTVSNSGAVRKFVGLLQRYRNITLPSGEPSSGALTKEYIIILKLSSFKSSDNSDNINEIEDTLYIADT